MAAQRSAPSPAGHGGAGRAALAFFLGRGSGRLWALHRPCWCAARVGAPGTRVCATAVGLAPLQPGPWPSEARCAAPALAAPTSRPRHGHGHHGPLAFPVSEGSEGGARRPRGGGLARARLLRKPPAPAPQQPVGARGTATSPHAGRRSGSAQGACQAHRSKLKACRAERVSPQGPGMERGCSPQFPGGMGAACPCDPSKM